MHHYTFQGITRTTFKQKHNIHYNKNLKIKHITSQITSIVLVRHDTKVENRFRFPSKLNTCVLKHNNQIMVF